MKKDPFTYFFVFFCVLMPLFAILTICIEMPNSPLKYILIIVILLFMLFFILLNYHTDKKRLEEEKNIIDWIDLREYNLPEIKINTVTNRQYQEYNYNSYSVATGGFSNVYNPLPFNIHITNDIESSIFLYYVKDIIFVCYKNSEDSWWGICKTFEENELIWELDYDFGLECEEHVQKYARNVEKLSNTKINTLHQDDLEHLNP